MRIDKLPVLLGASSGMPLAVWMAPRRVLVPLAALVLLVGVFLAEGAVGASVIDRYLLGAATVLLLFCAVDGRRLGDARARLARCAGCGSLGAAVLVVYGGALGREHAEPLEPAHDARLARGLPQGPRGRAATARRCAAQLRRCPLLSLPNNKLIPDARWILDTVGQHDIVARSQARADARSAAHRAREPHRRRQRRGLPARQRVFVDAIVDVGDDPRDQVPLAGLQARSTRAATTRSMATAEEPQLGQGEAARAGVAPAGQADSEGTRRWAWPGLAVVLLAGLGLRLWGVRQGLPYAYNTDEADHFVPHAVEMFEQGTLEPALLRQPAGVHVPAALPARDRLRRRRGAAVHAYALRSRRASTRSRASPPRCSARCRCGCCTRPARGCSAAASACSRPRSRRSRSCRSSTRIWRSTTCRRSRR